VGSERALRSEFAGMMSRAPEASALRSSSRGIDSACARARAPGTTVRTEAVENDTESEAELEEPGPAELPCETPPARERTGPDEIGADAGGHDDSGRASGSVAVLAVLVRVAVKVEASAVMR
jgi:hypothetical protein